jgi:hypothetical protein
MSNCNRQIAIKIKNWGEKLESKTEIAVHRDEIFQTDCSHKEEDGGRPVHFVNFKFCN